MQNLIPTKFVLEQNYPNPFNPSTIIRYQIPDDIKGNSSSIKLIVYDILGREVKMLVNKKQNPGQYSIMFDASNLSSGIYIYQLRLGNQIISKKMILLR